MCDNKHYMLFFKNMNMTQMTPTQAFISQQMISTKHSPLTSITPRHTQHRNCPNLIIKKWIRGLNSLRNQKLGYYGLLFATSFKYAFAMSQMPWYWVYDAVFCVFQFYSLIMVIFSVSWFILKGLVCFCHCV